MRMQGLLTQVAPAIDAAKHRAADDAGDRNPVQIGLYRTEL